VAAFAAVIVIALRVHTVIVAHGVGVGALTLPELAGTPGFAGMATRATVVGVGCNVGARSIAADLVGCAQTAISRVALVLPHLKDLTRVHPAADARDEHHPIVAEVVAQCLIVGNPLTIGFCLACGDATTSRGGSGCLNRAPKKNSCDTAQQPLEHTSTRGCSP